MTKVETVVSGDKWYAIILKVEGPRVLVKCVTEWNEFLVKSSYVDDWNVNRYIDDCSSINIRNIGNVRLNLLIPGNGFVIYPESDPTTVFGKNINLYYPPLFLVRPTIPARSKYDINKFIYKWFGNEMIRREPGINQDGIDILLSRSAEEYSWCCQYENNFGLTFASNDDHTIKPNHTGWAPKESKFKAFLGKWYREVLEKQTDVWGASIDWGRGAWYTLRMLQTKPWKVPIDPKQMKIIANYYGLEISNTCEILHQYAVTFQSAFKYDNSYLEASRFDIKLIEDNSSDTDLIVIRKDGMEPVVTWRHCKTWHDLTISFFSRPLAAVEEQSTDPDEFTLIEKLKDVDGVILQGPAGSGKSTLLEKITTAISSVGSTAVSMAYTGKAVKVLNNKGVKATTIHSFLHTPVDELIIKHWPTLASVKTTPKKDDQGSKALANKQHYLTRSKLLSARLDKYVDIDQFISLGDHQAITMKRNAKTREYLSNNKLMIKKLRSVMEHPVVMVDEASMLGARMMFMLLTKLIKITKRLVKEIKVVLIGDKEQLPPVKDINIFELLQKVCPTVFLNKVHRIGQSGPLFLSQKCISTGISSSDIQVAINNLDVTLTQFDNRHLVQFKEYMKNHDCIFVSPYKKTVYEINKVISDGRSEQYGSKRWRLGDKIMITSNMSLPDVVNGDMGTIIATQLKCDELIIMRPDLKYLRQKNHGDEMIDCIFAYIQGSDKGAVLYTQNEKSSMVFGYCITVHKSQGSEWKDVFVCLQGIERVTSFLNRNVLYTAITRTQKRLVIAGNVDTVNKMSVNKTKPTKSLIDYYHGIIPFEIQYNKIGSNIHDQYGGFSIYEDDDFFDMDDSEFDF